MHSPFQNFQNRLILIGEIFEKHALEWLEWLVNCSTSCWSDGGGVYLFIFSEGAIDRQTERQKGMERKSNRERQTDRHGEKEQERQTDMHGEKEQ